MVWDGYSNLRAEMKRMTKTLKAVQQELKRVKAKSDGVEEAPAAQTLDISSIEKASFLQEEQYSSHGNPLHSTALEEDLSPRAEQNQRAAPEKTGRQRAAVRTPTTNKPKSVSKAVKKITASKENQEPSEPRKQGAAAPVRRVKGGALPTISEQREDAGKKRASLTATSKKGQRSAKGTSPGEKQRAQRSSSSSEELTDEDESFHPSKEKSKRRRSSSSRRQSGKKHKKTTKSSSESSERGGPSKKARDLRSQSDLDVVLNAFQEFVGQYKQTVNSDAVKRTIDAFSRSVEEQLSEIITESRELKNLKRENAKVNSASNKKRTRLLEANNDLIKERAKLTSLQKECDELEQRLKALREGTSLLNKLQELNRRYLNHRTAHPDEVETFGASCLPAMLLEARCIMGTEQQLKNVNDQLQQIIDETEDQQSTHGVQLNQ
ncbi:centromere protein U isoform X1 [Triplophysa dalaica]|uniref:centromere protein U isoform X1 n=2 Tax=Triplophysa dalaica TaxID=1582913 RepID=UPI0024DF4646|nr:centromere protein U isoform X1 [Triplophysa dalaica]